MAYRNVVVGTDGSETATMAVRHAASLAKTFGARLTLVTAYNPNPPPREVAEVPEELRWRITEVAVAEDKVDEARRLASEVGVADVRVRVERGDPADILISAAEDTGGDLIVVGSKGMASPKRFILGSVPNKVSHHAPCDIVIVHTAP